MRIAGMASNRGRNLLNIADRAPGGVEVAVILTNEADAPVLEAAAERSIPTEIVPMDPEESRREHERRVLKTLASYEFDLVCLDGYMRVVSDTFLKAAPVTLNVHPSLLPAFPGTSAVSDALAAGVAVSGCTVHVVTDATDTDGAVVRERVDAGPIVTQEPVPVYADDSPERLQARIRERGEFRAYPRAVEWFAEGLVEVDHEAGTVALAGETDAGGRFPDRHLSGADRVSQLRYGENPHQAGALYADTGAGVVGAEQLNPDAKALSYNNYNDADAALAVVAEFDEPAAAVIKHTNPAGCAVADSIAEAYERALATDPMSAFGGIVALNRECDRPTAEQIIDSFKEVVVAPGYTDDALETLRSKDNLRVLVAEKFPTDSVVEVDLAGGRLVQERDDQHLDAADLEVVTDREPTAAQIETMLFAWQTIKHVKSNAILFATGTETVGVGMGQVSRVDAVRLAAMKAEEHAEGKDAAGAVMASDAFFPFPDGIERAAEAGIEAVIQPGGSKNDDAVIAAADDQDMAMVLTGQRAFRHD